MAGAYDTIQSASISTSGPKLPDGFVGVVEIVTESLKNGFHGQSHIAEMVVHESNHHEAPVGFRPSWTANMKHPNSLGNIMCHIAAALGMDPKTQEAQMRQSITPQVCGLVVSEQQPLRGKFLEVSTNEIKTGKGNDFMVHNWSPTKKTFPSRINDAPVGAPSTPTPAQASPMMPGAFQMPTGALPGMPMPGQAPAPFPPAAPALPGLPLPGQPFAPQPTPQMPAFAPQPAPQMPAFAPQPTPQMPALPGMPMPGQAQAPAFAPPPMQLPPLPMSPPPPVAAPFPPAGWKVHPQAPGWFYLEANPQVQKTEADLRAGR